MTRYKNHIIALILLVVGGYLGYRVGYFTYCAARTYAVNECMEDDEHTLCESWDVNCFSYGVVKVLEVGKENYRITRTYFNNQGELVYLGRPDTMKQRYQSIYHPVTCPKELRDENSNPR